MKSLNQSKLEIVSQRFDYVVAMIGKASDLIGLTPLVIRVQTFAAPYFSANSKLGRFWSVARERLETSSFNQQVFAASVVGILVLAYAYYRSHSQNPAPLGNSVVPTGLNDQQQPTEQNEQKGSPSSSKANGSAINTDIPNNKFEAIDNLGDFWVMVEGDDQINDGDPSNDGNPGSSSNRHSMDAEVLRQRFEHMRENDLSASRMEGELDFFLTRLNTIRNLDPSLAEKVLIFIDEENGTSPQQDKIDWMRYRGSDMEQQITKMVDSAVTELIKRDNQSATDIDKIIDEQKPIYLVEMIESLRENAIKAIEKEEMRKASEVFYQQKLAEHFSWVKMKDDGDCFFHAIGYRLKKDQSEVRNDLLTARSKGHPLSEAVKKMITLSATQGGAQGTSADARVLANHYQICIQIHSHMDPQESTMGESFKQNGTIHLFYNGCNHWDLLEKKKG